MRMDSMHSTFKCSTVQVVKEAGVAEFVVVDIVFRPLPDDDGNVVGQPRPLPAVVHAQRPGVGPDQGVLGRPGRGHALRHDATRQATAAEDRHQNVLLARVPGKRANLCRQKNIFLHQNSSMLNSETVL